MTRNAGRTILLPTVLGLTIVLGALPSVVQGEPDRTEAEAAARTILSALKNRVIAEGTVAPNLLEEVTTTLQGDRAYGKTTDLGDAAKTRLNLRIDMTKPYETTDDMPVPRRWEDVTPIRDAASDALIRTRTVDTRSGKRVVVDVRAAHQRVYFYLGSSQLAAGRTAEASVEYARERFQKMVEAAEQNGLLGSELPVVVARNGEDGPRELEDGDVVYLPVAEGGPVRADLAVSARAPTVGTGEEHTIHVDFPTLSPTDRSRLLVGPGAEPTDTGYVLRSKRTDPVRVSIELPRPLFDQLRRGRYTSRLGTVLPVRIRGGGGELPFFLQFSEWTVVVSRFELRGLDDPKLSRLRADMAEELGERAVRTGPFRQFNEAREILGNLRDAWNALRPRVTPGTPGDPRGVVAAWARNLETGEDLVLGVHREEDPTSGARIAGTEHRPEFEILVLTDPRFVPGAPREDDADMGLEPMDDGEVFDESHHLDAGRGFDPSVDHEREWRRYYLHELRVTARPVETLEGPAGEPEWVLENLPPWDGEWRGELDEERAIDQRVSLGWKTPPNPVRALKEHTPGLYEFRLTVTVARKEDPEDRRSADVALRVRLVQQDIDVTRLYFVTQKGR